MSIRCVNDSPYVAIEGVKGAGKTTVLRIVRQILRDEGVRIRCLDPTVPGWPLHPLELLHGSVAAGVDSVTEYLYAYRSNRQALRLATQDTSDVVLGDRSFMTTLATRWERSKTVGERAHFDRCRRLEWMIPMPDHVIYVDAPIWELRRRVELRGRDYGRSDESERRLQEAKDAYVAIRQSSLPELTPVAWHLVTSEGPPDVVGSEVVGIVRGILSLEKGLGEQPTLS